MIKISTIKNGVTNCTYCQTAAVNRRIRHLTDSEHEIVSTKQATLAELAELEAVITKPAPMKRRSN
ncbi:MAG: hypothetical protein K2X04_01040 [Burkholderiales bacterium]|jgi:hypothetical protein|nr:hypothetical protein [Burkholderiales bacterium]